MPRCASTKNKKSDDQCPHDALRGHTMCGRHRTVKAPRMWAVVVKDRTAPLTRFQAIFRGRKVRQYLALCGPGVLQRSPCVNDEDVVTCVEKGRQDPFDYFGMEEAGKVWWFDFASIWVWSLKSVDPVNPYTRGPLTIETRKRLREMWVLRINRKMVMPPEVQNAEERARLRLTMLCQTFADNGFTDVSLGQLMQLCKASHVAIWRFLRDDCPIASGICSYMLSAQLLSANSPSYIVNSLRMLMRLVTLQKEPYITVFNVMSAIYRC